MNVHEKAARQLVIRKLAARESGVTTDDIASALDLEYDLAKDALKNGVNFGWLYRSTAWGPTGRRHYFTSQEKEAQWSAKNLAGVRRDRHIARPVRMKKEAPVFEQPEAIRILHNMARAA